MFSLFVFDESPTKAAWALATCTPRLSHPRFLLSLWSTMRWTCFLVLLKLVSVLVRIPSTHFLFQNVSLIFLDVCAYFMLSLISFSIVVVNQPLIIASVRCHAISFRCSKVPSMKSNLFFANKKSLFIETNLHSCHRLGFRWHVIVRVVV